MSCAKVTVDHPGFQATMICRLPGCLYCRFYCTDFFCVELLLLYTVLVMDMLQAARLLMALLSCYCSALIAFTGRGHCGSVVRPRSLLIGYTSTSIT